MKGFSVFIGCFVLFASLAIVSGCAQGEKANPQRSSDVSVLVGNWSGESVCFNNERSPACKDEVVVYHITKVADKTDTVNISADKIVDGKPVFMGAFDFTYDAKKGVLTSEFKNENVHLLIVYEVKGDVLEGSITSLPDKTQVRQIKVKKDKE